MKKYDRVAQVSFAGTQVLECPFCRELRKAGGDANGVVFVPVSLSLFAVLCSSHERVVKTACHVGHPVNVRLVH